MNSQWDFLEKLLEIIFKYCVRKICMYVKNIRTKYTSNEHVVKHLPNGARFYPVFK